MISIKTIKKDDDRGRQYRTVICFRDLGRLRTFVCASTKHNEIEENSCYSDDTNFFYLLYNYSDP